MNLVHTVRKAYRLKKQPLEAEGGCASPHHGQQNPLSRPASANQKHPQEN